MRLVLINTLISTLLFASLITPGFAELSNQLQGHSSPYLAMHGDDPVAWQSWNEAVLKLAQKENKLIFVSIGYFSCHWCHVMQRESYKDEALARRLNTEFIPVKVDRELDPALDAYLIDFVQKTRGYAGWPLNVFLTPDGYPVVGMVYLPKEQFRGLLAQLTRLWRENNDYLRQTAAQAAQTWQPSRTAFNKALQPGIGKTLHSLLLRQIMQAADDIQGGFGDQARFPMPAQLEFLLTAYQQRPLNQISHFLQLTLEQMASQGLRDHIGGGFFRYTVDPDWQTPHFEKMLYDNAQLAGLYLKAATVFKRQDFATIATETLDFMLREMSTEKGGMVASLSAVDEHEVEGGYYLWSKPALQKLLTAQQYEIVSLLWGLEDAPRFEAGYLPVYAISPEQAAKRLGKDVDDIMAVLSLVRSKLYVARQARAVPVDDKQLAAWNGLALSALVKGAQLPQGEPYRQAAQKIRNFLVNRLWDGKRLARAKSGGKELACISHQQSTPAADASDLTGRSPSAPSSGPSTPSDRRFDVLATDAGEKCGLTPAGLEDYAYAAQGLLQWAVFANNAQDRELAELWINIAWQRFYTTNGWRLSDRLALPGVFSSILFEDNPMPSPSAIVIATSLQLAELTGDKQLRQRAIGALAASQESLKSQPFAYATQIGLYAKLGF